MLTRRLRLRPLREDDLDLMHAIHGDVDVSRYLRPQPWTRTDSAWLLARHLQREYPVGQGSWLWEDRATGAVVGRSHLRPCDETGDFRPEIGWFLLKPWWGAGLAAEASRGLLWHAQHTLGLTEVIAIVHVENERSLRLAAALGFQPEGSGFYYGGPHLVLVWHPTPTPSTVDDERSAATT